MPCFQPDSASQFVRQRLFSDGFPQSPTLNGGFDVFQLIDDFRWAARFADGITVSQKTRPMEKYLSFDVILEVKTDDIFQNLSFSDCEIVLKAKQFLNPLKYNV